MSDAKPRRSTSAAYARSHARSSTKDYSAPRRPRELRFRPLESAEDARQDGGRSVGGCSSDNRAKPKPNFGFRLEPKPEVVWRFGAQTEPEPTSWRLPPNRNALTATGLQLFSGLPAGLPDPQGSLPSARLDSKTSGRTSGASVTVPIKTVQIALPNGVRAAVPWPLGPLNGQAIGLSAKQAMSFEAFGSFLQLQHIYTNQFIKKKVI